MKTLAGLAWLAATLQAQSPLRPLHVSPAGIIVDDNGKAVVLRGVDRSGTGSGNADAAATDQEYAAQTRLLSANLVRLFVNAAWWNSNVAVPIANMSYRDYIDMLIQRAEKYGNYVLVVKAGQFPDPPCGADGKACPAPDQGDRNCQADPAACPAQDTTGAFTDTAFTFWASFANKYSGDPAVLYDTWEDMHAIDSDTWNDAQNELIAVIRTYNPHALIFVEDNGTAFDAIAAGQTPDLAWQDLVWNFHIFRASTGACSQPASPRYADWPGNFDPLVRFAQANGHAAAITEWGGCNDGEPYHTDITGYAKGHSLALAYFDSGALLARQADGSYQLTTTGALVAQAYASPAGGGGPAPPSSPIPPTFFAISTVRAGDYPKVNFGTLAHGEFVWAWMHRAKGSINFALLDAFVDDARQHGLVDSDTNVANMAVTLGLTPGWAVANKTSCTTANGVTSCTAPPDNIQDWKDFLTAMVQHYNGKTAPHIRYFELWNEINVPLFWTGAIAQMVALAEAAYPILHQDPYSVLLTPSVAGPVGTIVPNSQVNFMTRYLQAGGAKWADGGAFHGYPAQSGPNLHITPFPMPEEDATSGCRAFVNCSGSIISKVTQMREVFDQNGLAGKPIYQTEGSWGDAQLTGETDTQVAWLSRWYLLQAGLRASANLQMAAWFSWGGVPSFTWGTIETAAQQPTAAALAYTQVFNWLAGANLNQPCANTADGTWICLLTRTGGYTAEAVWNTKGSVPYRPAPGYTQYRDLTGATFPLPAGTSVTIGAKPLLLESGVAPNP